MSRFLTAVPAVALLGLLLPGRAPAQPGEHRKMYQALHDIREATRELEGVKHDFGGHRDRALEALRFAGREVNETLEAIGDRFPKDFAPRPDVYRDYKDFRHLRHSAHSIEEAVSDVRDSRNDFRGHKQKALEALTAAHREVKECIEHIRDRD